MIIYILKKILLKKLPNKIKISLDRVKINENEWKDENKLSYLINDCINIENNIKDIKILNDNIKNYNNLYNCKIEFIPNKEKEINKFLDTIKSFGKTIILKNFKILNDSLIINKNYAYIEKIINWINSDKNMETKLLYRKSKDGDSYDTFHLLCDNQGPTLVLIKSNEGFIIGGYTPLDWDNKSDCWKKDNETFVFSLTDNKIFKKIKNNEESIYCSKNWGPLFAYIGFRSSGKKNMTQGEFLYYSYQVFHNFNTIIPNEKKNRFFDVEEVEIYKIIL